MESQPTKVLTLAPSVSPLQIRKFGATLTCDLIRSVSTLTYGGTLTVTATGDVLAAGDSFKLFDAVTYAGAFASYDLPVLGAGLGWNTWELAVNGTLIVKPLVSVSGSLALEGYVGPNHNGTGQRTVRFVATDIDNNVMGTWDVPLIFAADSKGNVVAGYTLPNVLDGAAHLSAKTAWTLRKRLDLTFAGDAAVADFTGAAMLPAGDLDGSNRVGPEDYHLLAAAWYQVNDAADLDGSGEVDFTDYFLLSNRWGQSGDPE